MSPLPHPPAASHRSARRRALVLATLGCSWFALPACYEGPPETDGIPWDGHGESTGDDDDDATGADDGSVGDSASGLDDGMADDGTAGPDDGAADTMGADDGGPGDGGTVDDGGGDPPAIDVPDNAYCTEVADWNPQWAQLELDILAIVNEVRAQGADCGSEGSFGPTHPLTMQPNLRCAARKHSKDMADRDFFDHTNPSGESPWDRMAQAGYSYSAAGENIAAGNSTAAATMDQWMNSDGHCSNIMSPAFDEIGVGYYPGGQYGHLWTQAFGSP